MVRGVPEGLWEIASKSEKKERTQCFRKKTYVTTTRGGSADGGAFSWRDRIDAQGKIVPGEVARIFGAKLPSEDNNIEDNTP